MKIEVKVCDNCKHKNPISAVECEKCGYDLTFSFPQMVEESAPDDSPNSKEQESGDTWEIYALSSSDCGYEIVGELELGRECDVFSDLFNSSNYTSRIHAKIRKQNGKIQVMDASTNGTFIDDRRIPKLEWIDVPDGAEIRFADISFGVRRRN